MHHLDSADDVLNHFSLFLLDGGLPAEARTTLLEYMNRDPKGAAKPFKLTAETVNTKARGALHMMMTMPEFQLA